MPYTLTFSDPSNPNTIIVPDMPPGINMVDTSLALVGRGYPNYGEKVAENFLHLLENFASPTNPQHPIVGQLWYDTSSNTLRVNNGVGWPNANGIYQQPTDPKINNSVGLKNGDIWVDTTLNELKIYSAGSWTLVGPATTSTAASLTGPEIALVTGIDQVERRIIKNWANGSVITVISADSFTPNPVIDGFTTLVPGVNLSTNSFNSTQPIFNGTAAAAQSLTVAGINYPASSLLRKDDQTTAGQVITGKVTFKTPADQTNAQGRDGLLVSYQNNYIQLYKSNHDAVLLNNQVGGKIKFVVQTGQVAGINALKDVVVIQNQAVRIDSDLYVSGSVYPNSSATVGAGGSNVGVDTTSTTAQYMVFSSTSSVQSPINIAPKQGLTYVPALSRVGINTNTPRGSLDIESSGSNYGNDLLAIGNGTITYPTPQYSGNASIALKGIHSDGRITVEDSFGALNVYWNAYEDATSILKYISNNVPAAKQTIGVTTSTSFWEFSGAPTGTTATNITFVTGAHIEPNNSVWFSPRGVSSDFSIDNSGTVTIGTNLNVAGQVTAFFSDDRLKTRLGVIENSLEKVNKLTGFYYEPNEIAQSLGYTSKRDVGVSAQELQEILPEVVSPAPIDPQYLTVNYEKIVPLLIEAIKELSAELNYIKGKIQ